ncbi:MAG: hypothetical protein FWG34_08350 [Oscillospiraceae bacterium]|nr:hypothetical protein [Oscillospiraceae bacterium]
MDQNNNPGNMNDKNGQPPKQRKEKKENPLKNWRFYAAYFITAALLAVFPLFFASGKNSGEWVFIVLLFCIPYCIMGLIAWAIIRIINRPVALGILFGSMTPFIAVFIGTGGCGFFMF